jgi:hypothetical protein
MRGKESGKAVKWWKKWMKEYQFVEPLLQQSFTPI